MNLLFLSPTYFPHTGGAEYTLDDLVRCFVEGGHAATIVTETGAPPDAEEYRHGGRVLRVRYPRRGPGWRGLLRYVHQVVAQLRWHRRILLEGDIDTACVARVDEKAWYLALLRPLLRFRLVVYLHGGELRELQRESPRFRRALRALFRVADAFVAVSPELQSEAIALSRRAVGRTHLIPNAVDLERIRGTAPARRERPYVLFAGRLAWPKNVGLLVRAFREVHASAPELELVIAGPGEDRPSLEALVAELELDGCVAFLGDVEREEVHSLMRGARAVVLPSLEEGHPLVVSEALAAGAVVLASSGRGVGRSIREGVDGALFDPVDAGALAALILRYGVEGPARDALRARAQQVDRGDWDVRRRIGDHLRVLRR